ncbi:MULTISPECIES: hypothetical protein [unclassified Streptomyces]|nr:MULTISPECIES: hypothetical protein [unclassified Streptomyces]WSC39055.1 hypothetical protein OHA08_28090 [Streptomyces sp. NBC_01763]WSC53816.1 hypothetical protein OG808_17015 [Streptomyces sp. NBC_01761]
MNQIAETRTGPKRSAALPARSVPTVPPALMIIRKVMEEERE